MSASWMVSVAGRDYGPYTDAQMAGFAAEGRLAPQSLVSRHGEKAFRPASQEPALASLFAKKPSTSSEPRGRPRGVFGLKKEELRGERAHLLVIADTKSRAVAGFEEELFRQGEACPLLPQTWLLRTDRSVNDVRNVLVQHLGKQDALFVADATHDKAAWFNFETQAEDRIRRLWSRGSDATTDLRAAE